MCFLSSFQRAQLVRERSWIAGTCHAPPLRRISRVGRTIRACVCTRVYAYMYSCAWVACRFFSHYRSPGVSPSTGGMLFLTGGGPRPRFFFPSLTPSSVFPVFFSLFYRCTHYPPFCFRIGILFIFHGPWPAILADCPPSPLSRVDAFSLN